MGVQDLRFQSVSDFTFLLRLYFLVRLQLTVNSLEGTIPAQLGLLEKLRKSCQCLSLVAHRSNQKVLNVFV